MKLGALALTSALALSVVVVATPSATAATLATAAVTAATATAATVPHFLYCGRSTYFFFSLSLL